MKLNLRSAQWRPFVPWIALFVVLVLVLPVVSFVRNRMTEETNGAVAEFGEIRDTGTPFKTVRIGSLGTGSGPNDIGTSTAQNGARSNIFDMIAPTLDESGFWIADYPSANVGTGARLRLFGLDASVRSTFIAPLGTTMFTPGHDNDLWMARSGMREDGGEELLRCDTRGSILATYSVPAGVYIRAIYPQPTGDVWILNEQWLMDSQTMAAEYSGVLFPIVDASGKQVADSPERGVAGTFIGHDGRFYELRSEPGPQLVDFPPFEIIATDPATGESETYRTTGGVRPFMADANGRIYAEQRQARGVDAPGISILGDRSTYPLRFEILDESGLYASLLLPFSPSSTGWAPAAWPSPAGVLYSGNWENGRLSLMRSEPVPTSANADAERLSGAQARILIAEEPPFSGDPYLAIDDLQRDMWHLIYSGLVSFDASMNAVPDLAVSIPEPGNGVSADGLTITWRITPGRTWHDGTPVTPADVVATWDYLNRSKITPYGRPFLGADLTRSVEATGDSVIAHLTEPFGVAPITFFPFVLPAHIIESDAAGVNAGLHDSPLGCGPYRVARYEADGTMRLVAHEDAAGEPGLDRLDVIFTDREGVIDEYFSSPVPTLVEWLLPQDRETLVRDAFGEIVPAQTGRWQGYVFNVSKPVVSDVAVRGAIQSAHPYATSWKINGPPTASAAVGPFMSARDVITMPASDPDTATAAALLADAGWRPGKDDFLWRGSEKLRLVLHLAGRAGYPHEIPVEAWDPAINVWRALGSNADWSTGTGYFYSPLQDSGFLSQGLHSLAGGTFRMPPDAGWGSIFDPGDKATWEKPYGIAVTGTEDAVLRELHQRARRSYDEAERQAISRQIAQRVKDLKLAIMEYPETRYTGVLGISGYQPGPYPAGDFWNIRAWEVDAE